ncbi:MAG TPA: hypothetical protein VNR51_10270 [Hyphomicrobium sp.]|nr:hypothetical protein [Hyphomicrobium sp.]
MTGYRTPPPSVPSTTDASYQSQTTTSTPEAEHCANGVAIGADVSVPGVIDTSINIGVDASTNVPVDSLGGVQVSALSCEGLLDVQVPGVADVTVGGGDPSTRTTEGGSLTPLQIDVLDGEHIAHVSAPGVADVSIGGAELGNIVGGLDLPDVGCVGETINDALCVSSVGDLAGLDVGQTLDHFTV